MFLKSVTLSLTLVPNDPTGFFGLPALAVLAPLGSYAVACAAGLVPEAALAALLFL